MEIRVSWSLEKATFSVVVLQAVVVIGLSAQHYRWKVKVLELERQLSQLQANATVWNSWTIFWTEKLRAEQANAKLEKK